MRCLVEPRTTPQPTDTPRYMMLKFESLYLIPVMLSFLEVKSMRITRELAVARFKDLMVLEVSRNTGCELGLVSVIGVKWRGWRWWPADAGGYRQKVVMMTDALTRKMEGVGGGYWRRQHRWRRWGLGGGGLTVVMVVLVRRWTRRRW
ncbi:hypothetical protein R6Q59_033351 [Mikania micrantha]